MTDKTTLPADWAIERALAESTHPTPLAEVKAHPNVYASTVAFARYIEKHEQPPADPWLLQARELAAGVAGAISSGLSPLYTYGDNDPEVQAIAAALRAAYEKGEAA